MCQTHIKPRTFNLSSNSNVLLLGTFEARLMIKLILLFLTSFEEVTLEIRKLLSDSKLSPIDLFSHQIFIHCSAYCRRQSLISVISRSVKVAFHPRPEEPNSRSLSHVCQVGRSLLS